MFKKKAPDIANPKSDCEKKLHSKNVKAIEKVPKDKKLVEKISKDKKLAEKMKLELAHVGKTSTSKSKANRLKASLVKEKEPTSAPKFSSNFKIPKKGLVKGQSSGSSKQQGQKIPQGSPSTPTQSRLNTRTSLYSTQTPVPRHKVQEIPQYSPLFEVQKWLVACDDYKEKTTEHRATFVVEESKSTVDVENEEEPMIIDTDEVVGSIHQIRGAGIYDGEMVCGQLTKLSKDMNIVTDKTSSTWDSGNTKDIFLVLDTNILASNLGLVDDLKRSWTGENGSAKIVLVIPWIVLQELDRLKDDKMDKNPALKMLAAGAVRYLHNLLISGDSQIRGQTIKESSETTDWEITGNDDRILQCCFQSKKRGGGEVILLTNDRNLCNKAIVNRLQACSKETIVHVIERMVPLPPARKKMLDVNWDGRVEAGSQLCDEILCQLKKVLHDILDSVLRTEMMKAFDEHWMSCVKIKPPWRLEDILKCLQMHWIAVFSFVVPSKSKEYLESISAKFKLKQAALGKDDLQALLVASMQFLSYFQKNDAAYSERIAPCIQQMRNWLDVVKNIKLATHQMKTSDGKQHASHPEANVAQHSAWDDCDEEISEEVLEIPPDPHLYLANTLHRIWNFMNNTVALIYESLGMVSPIAYQRPDKLVSRDETINTIPPLYSTMTDFGKLLETVLRLGECANPKDELFAKLAAFVENFFFMLGFTSDNVIDENITAEAVHRFCTTQETRQKLIAGYHQLEDLCNMIYRCVLDIHGSETSA